MTIKSSVLTKLRPTTITLAGTRLRPFPADVMDAAFRESIRLYAELSDTNPVWAKVYADYAKFRADQNLWIRFTEATFSRFMQGQKV